MEGEEKGRERKREIMNRNIPGLSLKVRERVFIFCAENGDTNFFRVILSSDLITLTPPRSWYKKAQREYGKKQQYKR